MSRKKSFLMLMLVSICFIMFQSKVYAYDVYCTALGSTAVLDASVVDLVALIIKVIQIAVPVLLVIFGMLDLVKGVISQKEDEIKKGQQVFIKRAIAAILVFFVIAIVKFLISVTAGNTSSALIDCINCFTEGSSSPHCHHDNNTTEV